MKKTQNYFLVGDFFGIVVDDHGNPLDDCAIALLKGLTETEAALITNKLNKKCDDMSSIECIAESKARKDAPRYLEWYASAKQIEEEIRSCSRQEIDSYLPRYLARWAFQYWAALQNSKNKRLSISFDPPTITFDGTVYPAKINSVILVNALVKADGDWVSGKDIEPGFRVERAKESLPEVVCSLIESVSGKGSRLLQDALV